MSHLEEMYEKFSRNRSQDTFAHLPFFREVGRGNVVEIGVFEGASTSAFLLGVKECGGHVFSIDVDLYGKQPGKLFPNTPEWTFINANSFQCANIILPALPPEFDVLFVDGSHEYEDVKLDLSLYSPRVKKGGLILVHDICPPDQKEYPGGIYFEGVRRAFDEFVKEMGFDFEIREQSYGLGVIHVR